MNTGKAMDLLDNLIGMIEDNQENDYDTAFHMAIDALKAQAERTEERTETHSCDCISRQSAIDAIVAQYLLFGGKEFRFEHMGEWYVMRIEELERPEEPKKCDTCLHVKEPWFNGCADCSDFELWEGKE